MKLSVFPLVFAIFEILSLHFVVCDRFKAETPANHSGSPGNGGVGLSDAIL